eukprot:scaffold62288_cov19-Tisochrysis_lutea.AAC.5
MATWPNSWSTSNVANPSKAVQPVQFCHGISKAAWLIPTALAFSLSIPEFDLGTLPAHFHWKGKKRVT